MLLAYENDVGAALGKACAFYNDDDAIQLARAANIVQRQFFSGKETIHRFSSGMPKGVRAITAACVSQYDS